MSTTYISAELRRLVVARAQGLCEYCLIAEADTLFGFAIDHIISEKHGGGTSADNLAQACVFCNQGKGTDLGSVHAGSDQLVRFFNPRLDHWPEHFRLNGVRIEPISPIGEVTARILGFNQLERLLERQALSQVGRYPTSAALQIMTG